MDCTELGSHWKKDLFPEILVRDTASSPTMYAEVMLSFLWHISWALVSDLVPERQHTSNTFWMNDQITSKQRMKSLYVGH